MGNSNNISGHTKLVGLIGSPVEHSQSPKIHNASFKQLGIDAVYLVFDVDVEKLPTVAPALLEMGLVGYNVTMPCKQAIIPYLDRLSDAARLIGAVNTVAFRDGEAFGDNTDGRGFWQNCRANGFEIKGKKAVIMGAGGAGSAIFVEASLEGADEVVVFNRLGKHFDEAVERARRVSLDTGATIHVMNWNDDEALQLACSQCDILVNGSKVGMHPHDDESPVPAEFLHDGLVVADAVYNPLETKLLRNARERGLATIAGLGMLLWQGAIAEEVWFPGAHMDVSHIQSVLGYC